MAENGPARQVVKSRRGGQITIPAPFRKALGIDADSLLQVTLDNGELRIRPLRAPAESQGSPWVKELYKLFAPVREEAAQYSEAEIDAAIEQAVKAVRPS